jgi:hypothetical protein
VNQKTANSTAPPTIYISADFGNHFTKMMITRPQESTSTVVVNSGLMFDQPEKGVIYDPKDSDVFYCKYGSKAWREKSWFPHPKGVRPFNLNGTEFCQGDNAKGMLAFPLLIGNAWDYLQDGDTIALNATTQNIHTTRDVMIAQLEGIHTITYNGEPKKLTILKPEVLAEGIGALLHQGSKKTDVTTLLDIGGDTVIVSIFAGLRLKGDVIPMPGLGTNFFVSEMMGNGEVSKILSRQPHNHDECLEIVRGKTFVNADGIELDFKPAIRKMSEAWLHEIFTRVIDPYKLRINESNIRLATGGAVHIHGISDCLKAKGYTTLKDGQKANVKGIHARLLSSHNIAPVEVKKAKKPAKAVKDATND